MEDWEPPVQHEAQNLDTIKAAMLAHNPQDSECCRFVRLSVTRLQEFDALKSVWQRQEQAQRQKQGKSTEKSKRKGKEKGKSKDKSKERTSDTSIAKCSFCKGNDRENKELSVEQVDVIDSDESIHVCPLNNGQGDGFRKSSETRPLPAAKMHQRGMRQISYDSEARRVTAVNRVLDVKRSIWSLRSMMDSGCDVYSAKDRCWIAKNNAKELVVIPSGGVFFVATTPSKLLSREKYALELNLMSQAESNEQRRQVHAGFGVPGPAARDTLDGDAPSMRIRIPTGPVTPSAEEKKLHNASGHAPYRR